MDSSNETPAHRFEYYLPFTVIRWVWCGYGSISYAARTNPMEVCTCWLLTGVLWHWQWTDSSGCDQEVLLDIVRTTARHFDGSMGHWRRSSGFPLCLAAKGDDRPRSTAASYMDRFSWSSEKRWWWKRTFYIHREWTPSGVNARKRTNRMGSI